MTFCAVDRRRAADLSGPADARSACPARSLAGALCGTVSGILIAKLKIPPFIATLGMMLIYKGLSLAICGAKPIYFNDTPGFSRSRPAR